MKSKNFAWAGGAILALGMLAPVHAQADRFDYFEFQGTRTGEIDGPTGTVDVEEGVSLDAATSANDVVFIRGQVDTFNLEPLPDASDAESGIDLLSVGPGVGLPLGPLHVHGQVAYERLNYGGLVGNGPGAEVGATVGPADGVRVGISARRGEPSFSGTDDIEYELYAIDGRVRVAEDTDLVAGYQEGTFETEGGDTDLNEVVSLGLRFGF